MSSTAHVQTTAQPRGRPRSSAAGRAIRRAALRLLGEQGYGGLTMEAIAARAGVGKATLYRRWKSPEQVVAAAVEDFVEEIRIPDTGSVEGDLLTLMTQAVRVYRGRTGRLLPGLLGAMAASDDVARAVRARFLEGRRRALAEVLERGIARGELPLAVDVPLVLDFLGGPLFYRLLVTDGDLDDAFAHGVVTTLLRGVTATAHRDDRTDP